MEAWTSLFEKNENDNTWQARKIAFQLSSKNKSGRQPYHPTRQNRQLLLIEIQMSWKIVLTRKMAICGNRTNIRVWLQSFLSSPGTIFIMQERPILHFLFSHFAFKKLLIPQWIALQLTFERKFWCRPYMYKVAILWYRHCQNKQQAVVTSKPTFVLSVVEDYCNGWEAQNESV